MKKHYALYWKVLAVTLSLILLGLAGGERAQALASNPQPTRGPSPAAAGPPPGPTIQWMLARGPQQEIKTLDEYLQHQNIIDTLQRYTNGRLKVVARSLGPPHEVIDVVLDRRADLGFQGANFRAELALWAWACIPGLSMDDVVRVWPHVKPIVRESFEKNFNVVYGFWAHWGPQMVFTKSPIRTMEDFKGLKIRTHSRESALLMQAMGAVPTRVAYPETYLALQRGVVDAAVSAVRGTINMKWNEVLKCANAWPIGQASWVYVINKDSWAALPDDLKPFVRQGLEEAADKAIWGYGRAEPFDNEGLVMESGMTMVKPSPKEMQKMRRAAEPIAQDWAKRAGPRGPEVLRIIKEVLGR